MSSVFLIGNCHLDGLTRAFKFFDSALLVEGCSVWDLSRRFTSAEDCYRHLSWFDKVFTMTFDRTFRADLDSEGIIDNVPGAMIYPTVVFGAFHPDVVTGFDREGTGALLETPLGPYNSALILYGYLKGYTAARTTSLFRNDVFERLGYYSTWSICVEEQLKEPQTKAYEFDRLILDWLRQGCFMHTPTHPKVGPVIDIAEGMMARAGWKIRNDQAKLFLQDDLMDRMIWPVYPEIAKFYGLAGCYTFKRTPGPSRWPEFMSLDEFVVACYDDYESQDITRFSCQRVDHWLAQGIQL